MPVNGPDQQVIQIPKYLFTLRQQQKNARRELRSLLPVGGMMQAAKKAWQWALLNPALEYNQNLLNSQFEPKIMTGGYGDRNFSDEWFWAATELFIDTKEKDYYDVILKGVDNRISVP